MNKNTCLKYFFDKNTKVIILGTFPGKDSRKNGMYYRSTRNKFWVIMSGITDNKISDEKDLVKYNIGLWDVFSECEGGNNNKAEKNPNYNDFILLKEKSPNLKKIIFNGKKAYREFIRYLKKEAINNLELKKWLEQKMEKDWLYSSSSACTKNTEEKIKKWKDILSKYI